MKRPEKFDFDKWQKYMDYILDDQFPKGECKQRGNALILYAEFQIFISAMIKDLNDVNHALGDGGKK